MRDMEQALSDGVPEWENPPWNDKQEGNRLMLLEEVAGILRTMTPQERAKLLQEFPADEVVAVAQMLQSLD